MYFFPLRLTSNLKKISEDIFVTFFEMLNILAMNYFIIYELFVLILTYKKESRIYSSLYMSL